MVINLSIGPRHDPNVNDEDYFEPEGIDYYDIKPTKSAFIAFLNKYCED